MTRKTHSRTRTGWSRALSRGLKALNPPEKPDFPVFPYTLTQVFRNQDYLAQANLTVIGGIGLIPRNRVRLRIEGQWQSAGNSAGARPPAPGARSPLHPAQ